MKLLLMRVGFSAVWALAGVYMLFAARRLFLRKRDLKQRGIVAEGNIVGFQSQNSTTKSGTTTYFAPIVKFRLQDGALMQFTSSRFERPNPYVVGQQVAVRYLPDDPNSADLDAVSQSWFALIALSIAIIVCFVVASLPILLAPPR